MRNNRRDIIVLGASAGGIEATRHLLNQVPANFPGSILIVLHRSRFVRAGRLRDVLSWRTQHTVEEPEDGDVVQRSRIYLAPRDQHMLVADGKVWLRRDPVEHFTRPAVDPLFRSAATAYGPRVVGVLLTGNGADGVAGLVAIKRHGGLTIAQNPTEATAPSMPARAIAESTVDMVLGIDDIAKAVDEAMTAGGGAAVGKHHW